MALQIMPDFHFYKVREVKQITINRPSSSLSADIRLVLDYRDENNQLKADVTLLFQQVARMTCPESFPLVFLVDMEIEDISSWQNEGIKYLTSDTSGSGFEIWSYDVEITSICLT